VDEVAGSRFMGHSSPQITQTNYRHVFPKDRHGASKLLAKLTRERRSKMQTAEWPEPPSERSGEPKSLDLLEASAGIEPAYTDLQSAA
jgi:hypothetical protein